MSTERKYTRREVITGLAATVIAGSVLRSDSVNLDLYLKLREWQFSSAEVQAKYGSNVQSALNMLGLSNVGDINCYHNADTLAEATEACNLDAIHQIEVDIETDGDSVYVAHDRHGPHDMDLHRFHKCVEQARIGGREKLILYDFKTFDAYLRGVDPIEQFNSGRPHVLNIDLWEGFTQRVTNQDFGRYCGVYPDVIWSAGHDDPVNDSVVGNLISLYDVASGNFIYPVHVTDYARDHKYYAKAVEAGVVFRTWFSPSSNPPDEDIRVIMDTIPPWQVICDFVH